MRVFLLKHHNGKDVIVENLGYFSAVKMIYKFENVAYDTKLGQGRDAVKQMISDNPELSEEIETKIKETPKKE